MQHSNSETVTLNDILITEELSRRSSRTPQLQAENQAMRMLIHKMARESETLLPTLVDKALELCQAGTAGVSLLETTPEGEEIFRWAALAGILAHHVGGSTSRNFSPCGVCLEQASPVLFSHPERYFTYFQEANTPIVEGLVLPLIADHHVFGTIWIMSHDEGRQFDSEDVRVMTSLADFTATALLLQQRQTRELLAANAALEAEIVERRQAEEQSRALIQNLPGGAAFVVDRNLRYLLAEGEALAIAGFKPEDFVGRTIFELLPPDLAASYEPLYRQALAGEPFEHEHNAHNHTYISRGTPLQAENGEIYAVLVVSYDISDRKRVEDEHKRQEANLAFLAEISQDLARLTNIDETMNALGEKIGGYFNVSACVFAELSETAEIAVIDYTWQLSHMPSFIGTYRMQDFVTPEILRLCRAGEAVVIRDVFADPLVNGEQYAALNIGSFLSIPLVRDGEWRFLLVIYHSEPHDWRDDEIELTRELANRIWTRLERARAEETLVESEQKYRSLFTTMDQGFYLIEKVETPEGQPSDFRYLTVNPAFERHTRMQDVVGKTIREFVPEVEQRIIDIYDDVVRTGQPHQFEKYISVLDQWIEAEVFPAQVPGQIAVLFSNISDRKQAERVLRESEERQTFLLELSDTLRAQPNEEAIASASLVLLAERLLLDRAYIAAIYTAEDRVIVGPEYRRPDLNTISGVLRPSDFPEGFRQVEEGTFWINNIADDPSLSDLDRQSLAAINLTAFIVGALRKGERNLIWAIIAASTTPRQWTPAEIALIEETAERTWAIIERTRAEVALRESETQRFREQSAREEEQQRAVREAARSAELAELDRAKTRFFSNVSHEFRTPLTLSLAPLQDALNDSVHPLDPVHRERLELVHRNSLRLLKLVNTLLDFSRIEAGRIEAVYEPMDLATYTAELSSVFRSAIERAGLQLIVDCPPLPEPVFVDREMWEKIVLNLLSNAFKFTFEGEIRVSLGVGDGGVGGDREDQTPSSPSPSSPPPSPSPSCAILQIQDTGTGIAPEHLPHLFERFYQVRGTQARTHEGSGIGLALVNELVRLQGGTIEVSSTLGEGTCFTIALTFGTDHLPSVRVAATQENRLRRGEAVHLQDEGKRQPVRTLASTAMGATAYVEEAERWLPEEAEGRRQRAGDSNSSLLPPPSSPARVLVVDDNADMREYLTRILSDHVQVEAITDGATALAVAQERVPDLILSDVMMPGLDGFELLQALRADPRTREVPIILLSARAGEEAIVEGLAAGADDYLIKPFSAQELVSRVKAYLQMAQLRSEALQEARTSIRTRDEMISTVSHELNTPLVAILGWTRLLRDAPPSPSILTKALDTIERNANLQAKLVQDLLDISRITAGKLRLNLQPVALQAVIEMAIAAVSTAAIAKNIHLHWQIKERESTRQEPHSVWVLGDRDRLQQVLCNLITNAIKFTPESGSVTVELSVVENENDSDAPCAQIEVADTGMGISPEFLPHVFERFRQAEGSNAVKGLGLGLAIAHHLVELHNGTIAADSAGDGQGATFIVRLPLLETHD